jgi:hypothetical protein
VKWGRVTWDISYTSFPPRSITKVSLGSKPIEQLGKAACRFRG